MATQTENGLIQSTSDRALEVWYPGVKPAQLSKDRFALHDLAVSHIGADTDILYLEFGVARGVSLKRFASRFTHPKARFVGFDSFIGLPEEWSSFPAGTFTMDGKPPDVADPRTEFVKGWFQNSVPGFLSRLRGEKPKATVVHFDADLYSSTLFLLSALWWVIPEYYFIYDEFVGHELAALRNFMAAYPVKVDFFARTDNQHGQPVQIFGHSRNTELVVDLPEPVSNT